MTLPDDTTTDVTWTQASSPILEPEIPFLSAPIGFGAATTGGAGGRLLQVTTDTDYAIDPEPGSLRWATQQPGPKWIVFAGDVSIRLAAELPLDSNTTIDGRWVDAEIIGNPFISGLQIAGAENVIVTSLRIHGFGDLTGGTRNDPHDAIRLDGARRVWIDHNDLSESADKAVAISGGSTEVSVTSNHFHHQSQTMQIGNMTNAMDDVNQTVTVARNHFDGCGYRMPVVSYGKAHVFNNLYENWAEYAIRSQRIAQTYVEGNIFRPGADPSVTLISPANDGANDAGTLQDVRDGYLFLAEKNDPYPNLYLGSVVRRRSTGLPHMFDPRMAYAYTVEQATEALAADIAADAGPQ